MVDYVVGIDLGGTKIYTALATLDGKVRAEVKVPTQPEEGYRAVLERMAATVEEVKRQAGFNHPPCRVGLGVPGPLDPVRGVVHVAPNLGWRDMPVKRDMEDILGVPVYLDNDANLAAWGEYRFGAGRGTQHLIYLTVSTGIGGGLILEGKIYRGACCLAGEIGHMTLWPEGPRCHCGNYGCLEALASGTAVAREARRLVAEGKGKGILAQAGGDPEAITAKTVGMAAAAGDAEALALFQEVGRWLGIGLATLLNLLNPEVIVFGGGMMASSAFFWDTMVAEMQRRALPATASSVKLAKAELGGRSGVLGAVALALEPV
ncbi:ROK family protein [Ammonifex degensii KC4]|uniref:ROK family protein n=1 Tax=Ammonifex degensii (strain DSM 10501 / KC4) TaxID=429009 RepID=C9R9C8_AMMDK|nr:ROK family protein [Ammonifex degensii]ACX52907.1 ROK family protein [Ammonifex degensii KC4]